MNKMFFLLSATIMFFSGCNLAPKYTTPKAPVSAAWPTGAAYKEIKVDANTPLAADLKWQDFYTDQHLRKVIELTLANNRDLRVAALNIERTRAIYQIQRSELLPSVDAAGNWTKQRLPADLSQTGQRATVEQYSVGLGISNYELDLFGRVRNLKDRALEQYFATEQARRSLQISLIAEVANVYLALAADHERLKLAEDTLTAQQASYDLIKTRYNKGITSEIDLRQAQTRVDAAKVDTARYTSQIARDENILNVLVGTSVPADLIPGTLGTISPMKDIAVGLPSEVLQSRPDVLQAEHELKAANADIGAARAAYFPNITLSTSVGTASTELSGLFESGSGTWAFAPQVTVPIFNYGRNKATLEATKAQHDILLAQYEKSIQAAFAEVADALAEHGTVGDQLAAQQSLVDASAASYKLSEVRYLKGIDNYLVVLDSQRSLYSAQQSLINVRQIQLANILTLYKALGGGE